MNNATSTRGFTLMELLVVLAILGVVSTVGFVTYGRMVTYWGDLRTRTALEGVADNVLNSFREDLGAVVSTKLIASRLAGEKTDAGSVVSFPIQSQTPSNLNTASIVQYKLGGGLKRSLADALNPDLQLSETVVGKGVTQFLVEYAPANGAWQDAWSDPVLPKAVRVSVVVADPDYPEKEQVARKAVFTIHVD